MTVGTLAGRDDAGLCVALGRAAAGVDGNHDSDHVGCLSHTVALECFTQPECAWCVVEPLPFEFLTPQPCATVAVVQAFPDNFGQVRIIGGRSGRDDRRRPFGQVAHELARLRCPSRSRAVARRDAVRTALAPSCPDSTS